MAATTLDGVILKGVAASRPAANAVAKGTIYSATDTGAITQSDGSSWSAYATIPGSSSSPQYSTIELGNASDTTLSRASAGVVAVEGTNLVKAGAYTASGLTMATARLLGRTTASTGAAEEISVGSGLTLSAGSLSASGGGGAPAFRGASVYKSGTQSLSDSTDTAITFDTEYFDTNTLHDTSSNSSRIVLDTVGYWLVIASLRFAANATGRRALYFRVNANASSAGGTRIRSGDQWAAATASGEAHVNGSAVVKTAANTDYVEVFAFQTSGGALNVVADSALEAYLLGT